MDRAPRSAPLAAVLAVTFLGSVSGGAFWAGIFFVTARDYGFSSARNLLLAAVMGAVYAVAALRAGVLVRALSRRVSPRGALAASLCLAAAAACAPLGAPGVEAVIWAAAVLGVFGSAITWPIVESYLGAGRHGPRLRHAIGLFNVIWTPAVAVPLLLMPLLPGRGAVAILAVAALANALALLALVPLPPRPAPHGAAEATGAVGPDYPLLARSAGYLLPLSYLISSTIGPVLPHRLEAIGVRLDAQSLVAAVWMLARFLTLLAMWRSHAWHGRWSTLAAGGAALVVGLAGALLASTLPGLIAGLLVFGVGMGITYYAALYYTLAVGHAAVEAGGTFEGLVGLGYCAGPLLGLAGHALGGAGAGAQAATVALTWLVVGGVAYPTLRPFLAARRARR